MELAYYGRDQDNQIVELLIESGRPIARFDAGYWLSEEEIYGDSPFDRSRVRKYIQPAGNTLLEEEYDRPKLGYLRLADLPPSLSKQIEKIQVPEPDPDGILDIKQVKCDLARSQPFPKRSTENW